MEKDGESSEDREEVEGQELEADNFNVGTDEEDEKDMVDEGNSEQELEVKQPEDMVEENSSEPSSSTGARPVGRGVAGWQHNLALSLTPQVFSQLDGQADEIESNTGETRVRHLETAKSVLDRLLGDGFDRFEILNISRQWGLELGVDNFSRQKYQLQKMLVEHILREENCEFYQKLLKETGDQLNITPEYGYRCCLIGCTYRTVRHREYIRHLKEIHPTLGKYTCNFGNICRISVSSINHLVEHV